jgi:hypothetical protein
MSSWMLIFVAYLVPAVIGLPLLLLWDWLLRRRRLALSQATNSVQTSPSRSSMRANSVGRMRRMCLNTANGGRS